MMVLLRELSGLAGLPRDRSALSAWAKRNGIATTKVSVKGGQADAVQLSDLPLEVQRAYELRAIAEAGLDGGEFDVEAHERFLAATPKMRAVALRKAEIARFLAKAGVRNGRGLTRAVCAAAQAALGDDYTSAMPLRRISQSVEGVDPVNFAAALLPDYDRTGRPAVEISEGAWAFFMTTLRDAGPQFPLKQAWRDVRDVARKTGWNWPKYETVWRRWNALPEAQKLTARHGREAAVKALAMPIKRDKTTIKPLEWVSLDGRTQDYWVDFGDGKPVRPVMLALIDVASNYVLGFELVRSENAVATARLIRTVSKVHGIFDRLYTDNGSAFAGHLVAGGTDHKWRGKARGKPGVKPLGVCKHLGIEITFALPKNAQAKIAERTFATLSRVIDDRPEFKGAHAGHAPGATPNDDVVPVPFELAERVVRREIDRHNFEEGRCGQGARGRSYAQMFRAGLGERILRFPTASQLYYASLIYTPSTVDRWGRVEVDTWTYGDAATQSELIPWHGKGQILIGRDPDDFEAPAVAFDGTLRLICKDIVPVKSGVYGSVEGKREAAKNRKAARDAVRQADKANAYLDDTAFAAALADLSSGEAEGAPTLPSNVVGARFGGMQPNRAATPNKQPQAKSAMTPEMLRNLDQAIGYDPARLFGK